MDPGICLAEVQGASSCRYRARRTTACRSPLAARDIMFEDKGPGTAGGTVHLVAAEPGVAVRPGANCVKSSLITGPGPAPVITSVDAPPPWPARCRPETRARTAWDSACWSKFASSYHVVTAHRDAGIGSHIPQAALIRRARNRIGARRARHPRVRGHDAGRGPRPEITIRPADVDAAPAAAWVWLSRNTVATTVLPSAPYSTSVTWPAGSV